jgi:hypothetical protein
MTLPTSEDEKVFVPDTETTVALLTVFTENRTASPAAPNFVTSKTVCALAEKQKTNDIKQRTK